MKLTREEALRLHREMWTDMQKVLGDNPSTSDRGRYKDNWCNIHFPNERIENHCFLCEAVDNCGKGEGCLVDWGFNISTGGISCLDGKVNCYHSPTSEILALPERTVE